MDSYCCTDKYTRKVILTFTFISLICASSFILLYLCNKIDKSMISRHENEPSLRIVRAPVFQVPLKNGLPMSTRLTVRVPFGLRLMSVIPSTSLRFSLMYTLFHVDLFKTLSRMSPLHIFMINGQYPP